MLVILVSPLVGTIIPIQSNLRVNWATCLFTLWDACRTISGDSKVAASRRTFQNREE